MKPRPYQVEAIENVLESLRGSRRVLACMPTGCLAPEQPVIMADGRSRALAEVEVGDSVMGSDGCPRNVTAVHRGEAPFVRVVPVKGEPWICTTDHWLTLVHTVTGRMLDVAVAEWMIWPKSQKHLWKLARCGPIEFGERPVLPLDPYFLGVLLGDGTLANRTCKVTTMEPEVVEVLRAQAEEHRLRLVRSGESGKSTTWRLSMHRSECGRGHRHPIISKLDALGLMSIPSETRFVPECYKFADIGTRREMLAGLVDTDGYATNGGYDIAFKSRQLADDTAFLARSLGLACYTRPKIVNGCTYHRMSISGECSTIPCRVARRILPSRRQKKSVRRTGFRVEVLDGHRPYAGITVDGDSRFLLGDFTITHNCGKTVSFMSIVKLYVDAGHCVLILAHRKELLAQAWKKGFALGIDKRVMAFEQAERAEATDETRVVFSTVPSMLNRLDRFPAGSFQLVIVDEGHRCLAPTYVQLLDHFDAKTQAWTATPNRGDERALAQVIDAVAFDYTLADALADGWLVPGDFRSIKTSFDLSKVRSRNGELMAGELGAIMSEVGLLREIIGPSLELAGDKKAIMFCVTRAHMACAAECVRSMAEERMIDLPIAMIDGTTPDGERDRILAEFHSHESGHGRGRWLLNVDVCTEGFDVPDVEAMIIARPTLARSRYMQMVGRGLRPLDGLVDGVDVEAMLVRLDLAEARGAELEYLAQHRLALMTSGTDALARRIAIATSTKPVCLVLDFAGNSGRHELANPLDLLGGDFTEVERREAQRLLERGEAPNLWAALEQVRAAKAAKLQERLARHGDPFALFGIPVPSKSRFDAAPTPKQAAVIEALRCPRKIADAREAETLVRELARRDAAGLALYSQAALLAALGHPLDRVRSISRREASRLVREAAANGWRRPRRAG